MRYSCDVGNCVAILSILKLYQSFFNFQTNSLFKKLSISCNESFDICNISFIVPLQKNVSTLIQNHNIFLSLFQSSSQSIISSHK